jgi:hypothetical protein
MRVNAARFQLAIVESDFRQLKNVGTLRVDTGDTVSPVRYLQESLHSRCGKEPAPLISVPWQAGQPVVPLMAVDPASRASQIVNGRDWMKREDGMWYVHFCGRWIAVGTLKNAIALMEVD